MIDRYCTPAMSAIWDRQAKYQRWMEVEIAICQGYTNQGVIPAADMEAIRNGAGFDLDRCDELEQETRHDLVAFVRCMSEYVSRHAGKQPGEEGTPSRWIHFGVTSYDVIDTALGMMMRDSVGVLIESATTLRNTIYSLARNHKDTPCIGRTHGIHAEPITFGHKLGGWVHELDRSIARLSAAKEEISVGKISGAVGIHAHVDPELEAKICESLGLRADPASTQIVARDRHASLLCDVAVLAGSLERFATELRNLQRTEILEVQEEFAKGQTGSSAMPHKRNPWNSETVCGLARLVRGNAHAMLESIMTWHERDLSNSSLERIVFPDTFQLADFMLNRLNRIVKGLVVMPENMARNLRQMGDLVFSEHLMVALVRAGMSREAAYKVAQRNAAEAWDGEDFKSAVLEDPDVVNRLSAEQREEIFCLEHHLRNAEASLPKS
ncbi:MAG: adenylosuccinate lyase [Armatimonadetes bacterium]|nr:adenylosuccinate lyase [Armatimonadota bacterium]